MAYEILLDNGGTIQGVTQSLKRQNIPLTYVISDDGSLFHADSMTGGASYTSADHTSAAGVIQSAFSALTRGGIIFVKSGDYPMGTASPAVTFGIGGFTFIGEGRSRSTQGGLAKPGTRFLAGANSQTLFQGTAGKAQLLQAWTIENMICIANGFTGLTALDMTCNESFTDGSIIDNFQLSSLNATDTANNGQFGTGIILDGCDDLRVKDVSFNGLGNQGPETCSVTDVHWDVPNGTVYIDHPIFTSHMNLIGNWGVADIGGGMGTISAIKLDATAPGSNAPVNMTHLHDVFLSYQAGAATHKFDMNGFNCSHLRFSDLFIRTQGAAQNIVRTGGGTLKGLVMDNVSMQLIASQQFVDTPANVGTQRLSARNVLVTAGSILQGNNPFTVDGNGWLADPGFTTTTPAVPATGTAVQNTNGYPVRVLFLTIGTVTAIGVTDPAGTLGTLTTTSDGEITLGPMAKITLTYAGAAPTWKWYGVNP